MARSYGRLLATEGTVVVEGLVPLQRALRLAEGNTGKHLKRRLREAAQPVADQAKANVTHKTGRHGNSGPTLERSIKVGVNARSVSVYSAAVHAIVQDQGGRVGRNRATLLRRASVSQYMTRAVQQKTPEVIDRVDRVLDDLAKDFKS